MVTTLGTAAGMPADDLPRVVSCREHAKGSLFVRQHSRTSQTMGVVLVTLCGLFVYLMLGSPEGATPLHSALPALSPLDGCALLRRSVAAPSNGPSRVTRRTKVSWSN